MLLAALALALTLLLVVGVHEAGHALAARGFGVRIKRISIGFGRAIFQWQSRKGSLWIWALWPLGGYVELLNSRRHSVVPKQYAECFDKKPIGVRVLILLAGVSANLILAWLAFIFVFSLGMNYKPALIQWVQTGSPAARAGFQAGDRLMLVHDKKTSSWQEVGMQWVRLWGQKSVKMELVQAATGKKRVRFLDLSALDLKSGSLLDNLGIVPQKNTPDEQLRAGSFAQALYLANQFFVEQSIFYFTVMKQLILGKIPFSVLLGPLSVFMASIHSFTQGVAVFMYFIASLSLTVALFNLLPIPGLDGGGNSVLCAGEPPWKASFFGG